MLIIFQLHLFALGPQTRRICNTKRPNIPCSKLSDYDDLCERAAEHHHLKGFYRAFMSSSTQWLAKLFADVCIYARILNMNVNFYLNCFLCINFCLKEQVLFDTFEEIFEEKPAQNEILDVQGFKPQ